MKVKVNNKKNLDNNLLIFNKPKEVFIPLISGVNADVTILVKKGEYVYKNSIIAKTKGDFRIPIFSSVSGVVTDFVTKTSYNGSKVKCVAIENDFKELTGEVKVLDKYTKEEFILNLKDNGIVGLGGASFPTYVKYENKNIKTLIVNALECEEGVLSDSYIGISKCEEILECIDNILDINKIENAYILITKDNIALKEAFDNYIGTYLRIKLKLVDNYYPIGYERKLLSDLFKVEYNKYPTEVGYIVNNISTIYAISRSLKYNIPLTERVVTFNINDKSYNVLVKLGTPLEYILSSLKVDANKVISGGAMMGVLVDKDLVMSFNINSIIIKNIEQSIPSKCIRCGKCVRVCPMRLSPILIMNANDDKKLMNLHTLNCIECGLCSYICPSKIELRTCIKNKKKKLRGDK